jgi:transcription antitermination factor NusG
LFRKQQNILAVFAPFIFLVLFLTGVIIRLVDPGTTVRDPASTGGIAGYVGRNLENSAISWSGVKSTERAYVPAEVDSPRWYALHVRSRHEKTVETSLTSKGYSVFSPFYRTKRKRSDRTTEIDVALFPGYVFCHLDPACRLPILTTSGVVTIVGPGNIPEPIEDREIDSIRRFVTSGRSVQPWPFLRAGQKVRIQAGPLSGIEGTLVQVKNEHRLIASITLLQRSIAVEIGQDEAVPVF